MAPVSRLRRAQLQGRAHGRLGWRPTARRYLALTLLAGPAQLPATLALLVRPRAFVMQTRKPELTDAVAAGTRAPKLAEVALMLGLIDAATFAAWLAYGAVAAAPTSPSPPRP